MERFSACVALTVWQKIKKNKREGDELGLKDAPLQRLKFQNT